MDYGFDAGFFDNRLELSVTGYNKLTSDRLYDKALPAQTGFSSIKANLGTVQNKGFELSLTAHPLSTTSPVNWDVTGTFSMNRTYRKSFLIMGETKIGYRADLYGMLNRVLMLRPAAWPKARG